jgi:hypothetical protein
LLCLHQLHSSLFVRSFVRLHRLRLLRRIFFGFADALASVASAEPTERVGEAEEDVGRSLRQSRLRASALPKKKTEAKEARRRLCRRRAEAKQSM